MTKDTTKLYGCWCSCGREENINFLIEKLTQDLKFLSGPSFAGEKTELIFLGSGGLAHEFATINPVLSDRNLKQPDTITLIDPCYFDSNPNDDQNLAFGEFVNRVKIMKPDVAIKKLRDLRDLWPIQRNTNYIIVSIGVPTGIQYSSNGITSGEFYVSSDKASYLAKDGDKRTEYGCRSEMYRTAYNMRALGVFHKLYTVGTKKPQDHEQTLEDITNFVEENLFYHTHLTDYQFASSSEPAVAPERQAAAARQDVPSSSRSATPETISDETAAKVTSKVNNNDDIDTIDSEIRKVSGFIGLFRRAFRFVARLFVDLDTLGKKRYEYMGKTQLQIIYQQLVNSRKDLNHQLERIDFSLFPSSYRNLSAIAGDLRSSNRFRSQPDESCGSGVETSTPTIKRTKSFT